MNRIRPELKKNYKIDDSILSLKKYLEDIDNTIVKVIKEIIERTITDKEKVNTLYIKTYFGNMTYNICLYSTLTKSEVGKCYPISVLLDKCLSTDSITFEMNKVVKILLLKIEENKSTGKTIWI